MHIENILNKINTYVMCSTLNQIVNYIPIKLIEKYNNSEEVEIFNITVLNITEESSIFKRFDNKKWDENLFNCLKEVDIKYKKEQNTIEIIRNDVDDICRKLDNKLKVKNGGDSELNISKIKPQRDRKILWNVTGGQRSTIFAIQEYIRKNKRRDDYLIYLEGNSNKIICGKLEKAGNGSSFKYQLMDGYGVGDLDLQKTFQLAGFEIAKYEQKQNLINKVKDKEYQLCKRFYNPKYS